MKLTGNHLNQEQAIPIFNSYIALLYNLIFVERNKFNLIIGPADSGTFMASVCEMLYGILDLPVPKILILPVQRYERPCTDTGPEFNNEHLIDYVKAELTDLKEFGNILFIDDEISERALTAKAAISAVCKSIPADSKPKRLLYTIIAENHGFQWRYDLDPVAIRYYAFGNKIRDGQHHINGSIFYTIGDEIFEKYKNFELQCDELTPKPIERKHLAAILTDGRLKTSKDKIPVLTEDFLDEIKRQVIDFEQDKTQFINDVVKLIREVIDNESK